MYLDNNDLPGILPCNLLEAEKVAMQAEFYLTVHIKKEGENSCIRTRTKN